MPKDCVLPKKGDTFVCKGCGMTLVITKDCKCDDAECVCLECCGSDMVKQCD